MQFLLLLSCSPDSLQTLLLILMKVRWIRSSFNWQTFHANTVRYKYRHAGDRILLLPRATCRPRSHSIINQGAGESPTLSRASLLVGV